MEEKKKSNTTIIVILVIVAALGVIAYLLIDGGVFNKKDDNKKVENNTEEAVVNKYKNINFSKSKNIDMKDQDLQLYIDDNGKVILKRISTGDIIEVKNITEKAKYLEQFSICDAGVYIAVLTENNNVYMNTNGFATYYSDPTKIEDDLKIDVESFKKVDTSYKIKEIVNLSDITPYTTCDGKSIYALTNSNELRKIENDKQKNIVTLGQTKEEIKPYKTFAYFTDLNSVLYFYENGKVKLGFVNFNGTGQETGEDQVFDDYVADESGKQIQITKVFYKLYADNTGLYKIYFVTKDNSLLSVSFNSTFNKDTKLIAKYENTKKVSKIEYTNVENINYKSKLLIKYDDNTKEELTTDTINYYEYEEI